MSSMHGPASWRAWQDVLNEQWPPHPAAFTGHRPGIPVRVRVVWETDGETWLDGMAERWDAGHVYVYLGAEPRSPISGVWVKPEDVRRLLGWA